MATRLTTRKNSALSIDEYVNSIAGGTKYDDEVVETLFNLHDADCDMLRKSPTALDNTVQTHFLPQVHSPTNETS